MPKKTCAASARTLVLFLILVPVIVYLLNFAYKKNSQSAERAEQCYQECVAEGYPGYDFQWQVFSGPQCECLGERE